MAHKVKGVIEVGVEKTGDWVKEKWNKSGIEAKVSSKLSGWFNDAKEKFSK
jgi:hypothetical protein